ncbi:hypothetical protein HK098_001842 [Nowakowskiella sp. JEL0407]|nr:hypothetical protein HK098_001842 [Nowakowskiella sp. JEL0407]
MNSRKLYRNKDGFFEAPSPPEPTPSPPPRNRKENNNNRLIRNEDGFFTFTNVEANDVNTGNRNAGHGRKDSKEKKEEVFPQRKQSMSRSRSRSRGREEEHFFGELPSETVNTISRVRSRSRNRSDDPLNSPNYLPPSSNSSNLSSTPSLSSSSMNNRREEREKLRERYKNSNTSGKIPSTPSISSSNSDYKPSASELLKSERMKIFSSSNANTPPPASQNSSSNSSSYKAYPLSAPSPRFDEMLLDLNEVERRVSFNAPPPKRPPDSSKLLQELEMFEKSLNRDEKVKELRDAQQLRRQNSARKNNNTNFDSSAYEDREKDYMDREMKEKERERENRDKELARDRERNLERQKRKENDELLKLRLQKLNQKSPQMPISSSFEPVTQVQKPSPKLASSNSFDRSQEITPSIARSSPMLSSSSSFDKSQESVMNRSSPKLSNSSSFDKSTEANGKNSKTNSPSMREAIAPPTYTSPALSYTLNPIYESTNEEIISATYVASLSKTLRNDNVVSPVPSDFDDEGFRLWESTIGMSAQNTLVELLYLRYLDEEALKKKESKETTAPAPSAGMVGTVVDVYFKIVKAKLANTRNTYCQIQVPDSGNGETKFQTEVQKNSITPTWNQSLNIPVKNIMDSVTIFVNESADGGIGKKDVLIGSVKVGLSEIISESAKAGYVSRWFTLAKEKKDKKEKDGNTVVGEILLEFNIHNENNEQKESKGLSGEEKLKKQIASTGIDYRCLFKTLVRCCLTLDLSFSTSRSEQKDFLSTESKAILCVYRKMWSLTDPFGLIALLECLFEKYKTYQGATTLSQRVVLEGVREGMRDDSWLPDEEKQFLLELFEEMKQHYTKQVTRYRDFFPKNTPPHALETTLIMLRMISKSKIYKESNPNLPLSFRDEMKNTMTIALIQRYESFQELAAPFNNNDVTEVVAGILQFVRLLTEDIELDVKYFDKPFSKDIEISKLTAETYLKYLVLTLENHVELFVTDFAVENASSSVFELYRRVRDLDEKYAKLVPSLKRRSNAGFSVERWFLPFVQKWGSLVGNKILAWVKRAVELDSFLVLQDGGGGVVCSESIVTVFKGIFEEFDFIKDLKWTNEVQNNGFIMEFAKTANKAIDLYCDSVVIGETKEEMKETNIWNSVTNVATTAANLVSGKDQIPTDISVQTCVKLCNIEYALVKLEQLSEKMNTSKISKSQQNHRLHRRTMYPSPPTDKLSGTLLFEVLYGENLKPCLSNGLSNPYVSVRVPEGTIVEKEDDEEDYNYDTAMGDSKDTAFLQLLSSFSSLKPKVTIDTSSDAKQNALLLSGTECELLKSRVCYGTLAPTWDEPHEILLPPITELIVNVNSKNLITQDDLIGTTVLEFGKNSRLRKKIGDFQTHEVALELQPQGRIVVRVGMVGEGEDLGFWVRRSKLRLERVRDDFVRVLATRIVQNIRIYIVRFLKMEEAVPLPSKTLFALSAPLSNLTASGVVITVPISRSELPTYLTPITNNLDKNFSTLCDSLLPALSQKTITLVWTELLTSFQSVLVPGLYGSFSIKLMNPRQVSLISLLLSSLKEFFHADGEGLGLSMSTLESRKYMRILLVLKYYDIGLERVKFEYEKGKEGRDVVELLMLIRLRVEREEMTEGDRIEGRKWVEEMTRRRSSK